MRRKCANPACLEFYTPSKATRPHEPFCSKACQQGRTPIQPGLALATVPTSTPISTRTRVQRKHGIDYRGRGDE